MHVNKGDILYHEVDCGLNPGAATIWWRPVVEYTDFDAEKPDPTVTPTIEPTATPEATATPEPDTERKTVFKKWMHLMNAAVNKAKTAGILCTRTVRAHT